MVGSVNGRVARSGFWFQDAKALSRLLDDALERRRRTLLNIELDPELRVRVEAAVPVVVDDDEQDLGELPSRPLWDGTFSVAEAVTVEECKLGGPTRPDRVTLYRRLRATIAGGVPVATISPRLTVGRGVGNIDRWRQLPALAQQAEPPTEPVRVDSAEKLAQEALYYLTTPEPVWKLRKRNDSDTGEGEDDRDVPATPALAVEDARGLLSRFQVDDSMTLDEVEERLRQQLEATGGAVAIDQLIHALEGWIGHTARSPDWRRDLTAASLVEELDLAARYLRVPPRVEALWLRLRSIEPALPPSAVAVQPWRDVQPEAAQLLDGHSPGSRIVFTAEGGAGKSFLLAALHAEKPGERVWVDAAAPLDELEEALAVGAWASARSDRNLSVFVDAVEQVVSPSELLAAVHRGIGTETTASLFVGARYATWVEMRDHFPAWNSVRLQRWSDARVRALAEPGRSQPLTTDLVDLLRTPLLLDLFVRTFAVTDGVPAGLATRHGVLRAYFERRVLPEAHPVSHDRRLVLDAGTAAILSNTPMWRDATPAAQQLVSEGVLTRTFGELRFRHTLLR